MKTESITTNIIELRLKVDANMLRKIISSAEGFIAPFKRAHMSYEHS